MVATRERPTLPAAGRAFDETVRDLTLSRPARRDALPEHTHYADTGCDLHPSCLTCPLVRCRYDEPGGLKQLLSTQRDERIRRLVRQEGQSVDAVAQQFGLSRRTIFRSLARRRAKRGANPGMNAGA